MTHPMRAYGRCLSIATIRVWQGKQHAKGEPCGLMDYFRAHDLCPTCEGLGTIAVYRDTGLIGERLVHNARALAFGANDLPTLRRPLPNPFRATSPNDGSAGVACEPGFFPLGQTEHRIQGA